MDTLEVLLTIVASVAAGALAVVGAANNIDWLWSKIYRERARRLEDAIDYLEDQGDLKTPARITPFSRDLILQTKIRYYGGASSTLSSTSLFDCVSQGIAVERTSYSEALRIIADGQSKQLLHLEIVGSPCSGRSTMLVRLSLKLREQHPDTVLWLHGNRINDSFDIGKLDDFRRLKHRATKATQAARRFIVVIDNFIPDEAFSAARTERETLLESRRRFLTRLREKCESHAGLPTVVITSARASVGLDWSIALLLKLSKEDEAAILNALTSTDPPLVIENRSVSLSDIWGLLGGEPQYKGSLETFLAQLVVHVDHQDYIAESRHTLEELRWDDTNRDAAKCIAACQLLDLEVPARVLGMALGSLRVSELEKEGKGHIRINRGKLSLSAPYTASFLLQNHFRVTSVDSLREVFVSLFAAWLNTNASEWRSEEVEFFRHVLYRLARPGRFLFLTTEDGIQIANSLFGQSTEKLGDFVLGQEDAKFLSEWALTLQRIGQNELPAKAVERALRMQRGRINDMQCFVSLCTVLSRMQSDHNTRRLRDAALSVLSLQSLLSDYARNHAQIEANVELHRRANEAISAYCSLLRKSGKNREILSELALVALDRPDIPFDSLTILNKAKALARLEDPQSETAFLSALELSKQDETRRHSPSTFVECYWGYARYRKSTKSEMSSLIRDYEELVACLDWKLGWPLDKKEAVVRDCIDLILNASGEVHAANGASLLTKCVLVIASFPSNRDTSLLVLDVADGILKCAQDRLAVGQDALALRHVETALSWTESYLQAVPEDPIVPADLLMRVLKPTSKFPQYYARLERSSGTIANVLAKCPTNSGAKYGARKLAEALKIGEF